MASSSHFLCSHHSYNSKTHFNSFTHAVSPQFSSFKPHGSSVFRKKIQSSRIHCIRASASDATTGKKQVEVIYDRENTFNKLADEVDRDVGMSRLTVFSPCKINVFLRITGKRADGFHDLASLFHVISLGDKIKFSLSPSKSTDRLSTNVPGVPLDERNLIIKALNLFRKKTGIDNYFWIHLDKKVPTGAGLGGGSSNAATALWAANQFSGCVANEKDLQEWSGEIGSDIPFFFSHGSAYCTGRGEVVEDIPSPIPLDLPMVLIKPQEACPTGEVYRRLRLDQTSQIDPLQLLENISKGGISQGICVNDLEPPAFEVVPSLKRLKQRIAAAGRGQYDAVFMSGSDFIAISDNAYVREQVLLMEKAILGKLEWYLTVPTPYVFLARYIKASIPAEIENMTFFFAELGLTNYSTVTQYSPSVLAASAVYAARCTLSRSPLWTETLKHHTGYTEDQLMECAKLLVGFHSGMAESKLKAAWRKYCNPERGAVALFPPARSLLSV